NITPTNTNPTLLSLTNSEYVHIKGLRVTGLKQHTGGTGISRGFHIADVNHSTFEFIEVDNIGGYGFYLRDGANDNYFLNCDAHHMDDRYSNPGAWGGSNGFDCTGGVNATRNIFEGCRAWWISDDGFDFYGTNGLQTLKNCWSFWNGFEPGTFTPRGDGDGFKLGPDAGGMHNTILRTLTNCVAFENKQHGYNQNVGDMRYNLYNNTSFKNGATGYMWDYVSPAPLQDFKNNVSYMDAQARRGNETTGSNNTWNGAVSVSSSDFLSISSTGVDGPRQADGSLPNLNFLHLASSSDLINAGINIGLPFLGSAPDMGAYELGGVAPNTPPTANAGSNQTITLPANAVSLTGSGTDPDGSIIAYLWTKVSGPASGNVTSPASQATTVTALIEGIYQFQLQVTDNNGATATDMVQVTVNAAPNAIPTANAGSDKVITLPTNSVNVSGIGIDTDGSITAYLWIKISGPSGGNISSPSNANTSITSLTQGVYQFQLKVTDNNGATATDNLQVTVNPAPNVAPTAAAGADQVITLPIDSVNASGNGTDTDGTITEYLWTKISGPSGGNITSPANANTSFTSLTQGVYQFQLKVTDNNGATATDNIQVTVNPVPNAAPIANAGTDQHVTLPTDSLTVSGTGVDSDGSITSFQWTVLSGPATATILVPNRDSATITGLVQGVYQLEFKVTDNEGATGSDTIFVTVDSIAVNVSPTANAGPDNVITLPTATITVTGGGSDTDGTITGYSWTQVSGPTNGTISIATDSSTTITALEEGIYVFQLMVTDNDGATATDELQVTVNALPPTVTQKIIHVNIYGGTTTFDDVRWNNWKPVSNTASNNFNYEDSTATTINAEISGQLKIGDNGSGYQPNATSCPPEVLRFASANWLSRTLTIRGLDLSKTYSFQFFSSSNDIWGYQTAFEINGISHNVNTYNNNNSFAEFLNIQPSTTGTITVTLSSVGLFWNFLSGFNIIEEGVFINQRSTSSFSSGATAVTTTIIKKGTEIKKGTAIAKGTEITKGIEVIKDVELSVNAFPIPFTTSFNVSLEGGADGEYTISLVDMSGQVLLNKAVSRKGALTTTNIYASNLLKGSYILQVISPDKNRITKKVIKN
ncbi:MAG: tandem-95 repeat protein, partial [Ferruginibacter sp.]